MTPNASFWNGILADPAELARDMWTYKGWQISFDMPPIPVRNFDWAATSPDYDCDYSDDGGFFCCAGHRVHAATYEELLEEIENCIRETGE